MLLLATPYTYSDVAEKTNYAEGEASEERLEKEERRYKNIKFVVKENYGCVS